jgi:hypothetical protein
MRNPEYMAVLAEAVEAVRTSMADRRLPELTPEQLAWWFRTATASDIERVTKKVTKKRRGLEVVWRSDPREDSDIPRGPVATASQQEWSAAT